MSISPLQSRSSSTVSSKSEEPDQTGDPFNNICFLFKILQPIDLDLLLRTQPSGFCFQFHEEDPTIRKEYDPVRHSGITGADPLICPPSDLGHFPDQNLFYPPFVHSLLLRQPRIRVYMTIFKLRIYIRVFFLILLNLIYCL